MGAGEFLRDKITGLINRDGSTIVLTPITRTEGNYGGYEPVADVEGTAVTTLAIPSSYVSRDTGEKFGRLPAGDLTLVIKYSETIDGDYQVTWQSEYYSLEKEDIKKMIVNNVTVGLTLVLTKKLS